MNLFKRIRLAVIRQREFLKARAELESHSERELSADLRLNRSNIPDIAAAAADQRVAAFVRAHPEYREAWEGRSRREVVPSWS